MNFERHTTAACTTRPADAPATGGLWIFGFGSLMWNPGFAFAHRMPARVTGFRRSFSVYSVFYRGSARKPGLVLGLDIGGSCVGIAYRVASGAEGAALAYLRRRELVTGVYREAVVTFTPLDSPSYDSSVPSLRAHAFVVERSHPNYAGDLPLAVQARLIRAARGRAGTNLEYFSNTLLHLRQSGIREPQLERLATTIGTSLVVASDQGASALRTTCACATPSALWRARGSRLVARGNRFAYRRWLG
ncbi:MAG: gamma-glutamylcyclotransferase [Hyphomicrobiaceae bacterium]|nr:gamma-glutamylcyclotransferase [Hyphomicrobiaceae bacterium]